MKIKAKYRPELICSRDGTRPAIQETNLGIVKGKVSLSATDGRRLLVLPVEAEKKEFGRVPKEAIKLAREKRTSRKQEVVTIGLNGKIELENGWILPRPMQEELTYPNVDNVIPEHNPRRVCFSAKYLYELAQAMGVDQVILAFKDDISPIVVTAHNEEAYAVLMPIRFQ